MFCVPIKGFIYKIIKEAGTYFAILVNDVYNNTEKCLKYWLNEICVRAEVYLDMFVLYIALESNIMLKCQRVQHVLFRDTGHVTSALSHKSNQ